ncbi:hypothetical protein DNH61_12430 [Paenibacillus sambharensis]|uniref:histidine kinase n=1 Tax=Paenibacillus sambharensis TaxID=1803190 RepID=A0A2W1LLG1_9BACL|nr:PAS domain-containing sensor histidine kinase [Paenibacillus sambharensis]PZD95344.1 hypothetical protein DNH61_12430 [Paenibacillus sambharensis]
MNYDEDLFTQSFMFAPIGLGLVNLEGEWLRVNPALCSMLGYEEQELLKLSFQDITHPEDLAADLALVEETLSGQRRSYRMEKRYYAKDGQILWVQLDVSLVRTNEGEPQFFISQIQDISERKQIVEELEETKTRLQQVMDSMRIGLWSLDLVNNDFVCSDNVPVLCGISEQELKDNPLQWNHNVHEDDYPHTTFDYLMGQLSSGDQVVIEYRKIFSRGEQRWHQMRLYPQFHGDKMTSIKGLITDITSQKETERSLADSENRYKLIAEHTNDLIEILDEHGVILYASPSHQRILGYNPDELVGRHVTELLDPKCHERAAEAICAQANSNHNQIVDVDIIHHSGHIMHYESQGTRYWDERERAVKIIAAGRHIGERKRYELELQRRKELYLKLQDSLDRFTAEIGQVIQKDDLNERFVQELKSIMCTDKVALLRYERASSGYHILHGSNDCGLEIDGQRIEVDKQRIKVGELIREGSVYLSIISESADSIVLVCVTEPEIEDEAMLVWLQTIIRFMNVLYQNFRTIEDLMNELSGLETSLKDNPVWLSRLLFRQSESERSRLSQDLHDGALQGLILWYRKLELIDMAGDKAALNRQVDEIREGLLDIVYQIRLTCNELRPPFIREWGIIEALQALFADTQRRADFAIEFRTNSGKLPLSEEHAVSLYRIVQELLANAEKHSMAASVSISLNSGESGVLLRYEDNGVGTGNQSVNLLPTYSRGMGIYGMKERVRVMGGTIKFRSGLEGFAVDIWLSGQGYHGHCSD